MNPEKFISQYETALATQDWAKVAPLISDSACVTFSNGKVNQGIENIKAAFEHNFSLIKSEKYKIENVVWLKKEDTFATYIFEYLWAGIINGEPASGKGIGTSIIINEKNSWKLLSEHLGKKN